VKARNERISREIGQKSESFNTSAKELQKKKEEKKRRKKTKGEKTS